MIYHRNYSKQSGHPSLSTYLGDAYPRNNQTTELPTKTTTETCVIYQRNYSKQSVPPYPPTSLRGTTTKEPNYPPKLPKVRHPILCDLSTKLPPIYLPTWVVLLQVVLRKLLQPHVLAVHRAQRPTRVEHNRLFVVWTCCQSTKQRILGREIVIARGGQRIQVFGVQWSGF